LIKPAENAGFINQFLIIFNRDNDKLSHKGNLIMPNFDEKVKQIINEKSGKGEIRVNCMNCEGSQNNTLSINTETGVFNCFRCGIKGNALKGGYSDNSEKSAQEKALGMLNNSYPVNGFPYLKTKQIKAYGGIRGYEFADGERVILIPVMNCHDETLSLQIIKENGDKRFLKDTEKKGNFFRIQGNENLYLCEGYATGASIHEATGGTVYIAFDAGNLESVLNKVIDIHTKKDDLGYIHPNQRITVCADNDHKAEGNPGVNKAIKAALQYEDVKVVYPVDIKGTDFNDLAAEKGPDAVKDRIAQAWRPDRSKLTEEIKINKIFNLTDFGNAERLIDRHGENVRFSFEAGKWLFWNGKFWELDNIGNMQQLSKETVRSIIDNKELKALSEEYENLKRQEADKPAFKQLPEADRKKTENRLRKIKPTVENYNKLVKFSHASEQEARINAMVNLAKTEPGLSVALKEFDRDKWQFNCDNGTIDLRTGKLNPHNRLDLNMKISPVKYDPAAECPLWNKFLCDIFNNDYDLIDFIQRSVGYTLTGDIKEEVFWVLHGKGGNGKGTFINSIMSIMADYGKPASFPLLCTPGSEQNDMALNQLALLKGIRFVSASEGEENAVMNESNIKNAVSSDSGKIMARFKYQDLFSYTPVFKIFLATNYKPIIRGTDEGIWRRVMLIPFNQTFKGDEKDEDLRTKLQAELPGILKWAVEGCLKWQREGLNPPSAVINATEQYKLEMDWLSDFLNECCEVGPLEKVSVKDLYETYLKWAEGGKPKGKRMFNKMLEERGFIKERGGKNILYWIGLKVTYGGISDVWNGSEKSIENTMLNTDGLLSENEWLYTEKKNNPEKNNNINASEQNVTYVINYGTKKTDKNDVKEEAANSYITNGFQDNRNINNLFCETTDNIKEKGVIFQNEKITLNNQTAESLENQADYPFGVADMKSNLNNPEPDNSGYTFDPDADTYEEF